MPVVGPVLGASVPRIQIAPSSRCGRNSEPTIPLKAQEQHERERGRRLFKGKFQVIEAPLQSAAVTFLQE